MAQLISITDAHMHGGQSARDDFLQYIDAIKIKLTLEHADIEDPQRAEYYIGFSIIKHVSELIDRLKDEFTNESLNLIATISSFRINNDEVKNDSSVSAASTNSQNQNITARNDASKIFFEHLSNNTLSQVSWGVIKTFAHSTVYYGSAFLVGSFIATEFANLDQEQFLKNCNVITNVVIGVSTFNMAASTLSLFPLFFRGGVSAFYKVLAGISALAPVIPIAILASKNNVFPIHDQELVTINFMKGLLFAATGAQISRFTRSFLVESMHLSPIGISKKLKAEDTNRITIPANRIAHAIWRLELCMYTLTSMFMMIGIVSASSPPIIGNVTSAQFNFNGVYNNTDFMLSNITNICQYVQNRTGGTLVLRFPGENGTLIDFPKQLAEQIVNQTFAMFQDRSSWMLSTTPIPLVIMEGLGGSDNLFLMPLLAWSIREADNNGMARILRDFVGLSDAVTANAELTEQNQWKGAKEFFRKVLVSFQIRQAGNILGTILQAGFSFHLSQGTQPNISPPSPDVGMRAEAMGANALGNVVTAASWTQSYGNYELLNAERRAEIKQLLAGDENALRKYVDPTTFEVIKSPTREFSRSKYMNALNGYLDSLDDAYQKIFKDEFIKALDDADIFDDDETEDPTIISTSGENSRGT